MAKENFITRKREYKRALQSMLELLVPGVCCVWCGGEQNGKWYILFIKWLA